MYIISASSAAKFNQFCIDTYQSELSDDGGYMIWRRKDNAETRFTSGRAVIDSW
jgi:hypothetical protein